MKSNKKFIALSAIVIGAAILITSAFADVIIGSGYYSLKSAVKNTAAKLTGEVDNFTFEATATIKIDDMVYLEDKNIEKFDILNEQRESSLISYYNGETRESYSYRNNEQSISKDLKTGTYHVYSYNTRPINMRGEQFFLDNPFEDERVQDAERIMDAFVGSLQDIVQVEEVNNKKMYIGNLSDTQVPPIINAISSYFVKYSIFNSYSYRADESKIPIPKTDIYVLGASGKAIENENGILENIIGSIRVSGTDEDGNEHVYSVEISVEIKDINSTIVTKPDLEGKK